MSEHDAENENLARDLAVAAAIVGDYPYWIQRSMAAWKGRLAAKLSAEAE